MSPTHDGPMTSSRLPVMLAKLFITKLLINGQAAKSALNDRGENPVPDCYYSILMTLKFTQGTEIFDLL